MILHPGHDPAFPFTGLRCPGRRSQATRRLDCRRTGAAEAAPPGPSEAGLQQLCSRLGLPEPGPGPVLPVTVTATIPGGRGARVRLLREQIQRRRARTRRLCPSSCPRGLVSVCTCSLISAVANRGSDASFVLTNSIPRCDRLRRCPPRPVRWRWPRLGRVIPAAQVPYSA